MCRESPWALYFDSIVEDSDMYVISDAIVPMDDCVSDDFMKSFRRVMNILQLLSSENFHFFDDPFCLGNGSVNLVVGIALDRQWIKGQRLSSALRI